MPAVVRNINQVKRNMKRLGKQVREATIKAAEDIAIDLADKALNLAPVDTGELRKSADPEVIIKGNRISANVSFSAIAKNGYDYALIQHEDLSFNHPKGGQAKYLSTPLQRNAGRYKKHMENAVKKVTG